MHGDSLAGLRLPNTEGTIWVVPNLPIFAVIVANEGLYGSPTKNCKNPADDSWEEKNPRYYLLHKYQIRQRVPFFSWLICQSSGRLVSSPFQGKYWACAQYFVTKRKVVVIKQQFQAMWKKYARVKFLGSCSPHVSVDKTIKPPPVHQQNVESRVYQYMSFNHIQVHQIISHDISMP